MPRHSRRLLIAATAVLVLSAGGPLVAVGPAGRAAASSPPAPGSLATGAVAPASPTPAGAPGYWMVATDGGIFNFGAAAYHGSTGALALAQPIVGLLPTPTGRGYWLASADGGVFSFGDAPFLGSAAVRPAGAAPIVAIAGTPSGGGYWLVARDGGVYTLGDATYFGAPPASAVHAPIVAAAATPDGEGY